MHTVDDAAPGRRHNLPAERTPFIGRTAALAEGVDGLVLLCAGGGGLSILGDLFLTDPSATFGDQAANAIKNLAGPTVGSATELLFKNFAGNIWEAAEGKDTHWQAEAAAWVRSNTPGA